MQKTNTTFHNTILLAAALGATSLLTGCIVDGELYDEGPHEEELYESSDSDTASKSSCTGATQFQVGSHCYDFLPGSTFFDRATARGVCQGKGAGWDLVGLESSSETTSVVAALDPIMTANGFGPSHAQRQVWTAGVGVDFPPPFNDGVPDLFAWPSDSSLISTASGVWIPSHPTYSAGAECVRLQMQPSTQGLLWDVSCLSLDVLTLCEHTP